MVNNQRSWHGVIFIELDKFIKNLNRFLESIKKIFYAQETLFEIVFTLVFFIEQLGLFIFLIIYPKANISSVIGIFVLILLTTKAFEMICLQSRNRRYRDQVMELQAALEKDIETQNNSKLEDNENLMQLLEAYNQLLRKYEQQKKMKRKIFKGQKNEK